MGSFVTAVLTPNPVYYTYGPGETVYIEGDTIILNNDQQVPVQTYVEQTATIADSAPEVDPEQVEWMPLGVFALVDDEDPDPTQVVQLTVSKEGILAGMYQNTTTDTTVPLEGMVEPETGKAVFKPAEKDYPLVETGLYNLIEDNAQALVFYDADTVQETTLVRLDQPEDEEGVEGQ